MIAAPAIDLRGGRCVQLVGGRPEQERISLPDPPSQARRWWELGFRTLHVVDLDAALGTGHNRPLIGEVLRATPAQVQVGGGVRNEGVLEDLLALGASRVLVGTRALEDPLWLEEMASRHPGRIMVAADVRDGKVLSRGWTVATGVSLSKVLGSLEGLPLAGILCTDVAREGRMEGMDPATLRDARAHTTHPLWMSGGIASLEDLRSLREAGVHGAVLGMALYTGALPAQAVAEEFGR